MGSNVASFDAAAFLNIPLASIYVDKGYDILVPVVVTVIMV